MAWNTGYNWEVCMYKRGMRDVYLYVNVSVIYHTAKDHLWPKCCQFSIAEWHQCVENWIVLLKMLVLELFVHSGVFICDIQIHTSIHPDTFNIEFDNIWKYNFSMIIIYSIFFFIYFYKYIQLKICMYIIAMRSVLFFCLIL